jgi:hypothetical protein
MSNRRQNPSGLREHPLIIGVGVYLLSGVVVTAALIFGTTFMSRRIHVAMRRPGHPTQGGIGLVDACNNWDGRWYTKIVDEGYSYSETDCSGAAFFPAYPMLGRCVKRATGLRAEAALLVISHACLLAAFVMLAVYVRARQAGRGPAGAVDRDVRRNAGPNLEVVVAAEPRATPSVPPLRSGGDLEAPGLRSRRQPRSGAVVEWTLLAFAFFPPTLFFRMTYTESLFVLCLVAAMYAMECGWSVLSVASIVGLATGTRLVGAALLAPLALYAWGHFRQGRVRIVALMAAPFVGCWGMLAFMVLLQNQFGDPLAFAKAQAGWNGRPSATFSDYAAGLFSLEPIWSVFDPASPAYWAEYAHPESMVFNIQVLNVVCFVIVAALVAVGFFRGILNCRETLLGGLLLGIPYVTHSYQTLMWSEARFAAVVFPAYLVMGRVATRIPAWLAAGALGAAAFFLGSYTALFAAWHHIF